RSRCPQRRGGFESAAAAQRRIPKDHHHGYPRPEGRASRAPHAASRERLAGRDAPRLGSGGDFGAGGSMKFSKLIYRNIFRSRLRAILTVLLMAAIFFFIATLLSILENFTLFSEAGKGQNRLATQSAISLANVLPVAHEQKIRQIPGLVDVCQM